MSAESENIRPRGMHERAAKLYDEIVELGVVLDFGDRYEATHCAEVLEKCEKKLHGFVKRLMATPFQPDR